MNYISVINYISNINKITLPLFFKLFISVYSHNLIFTLNSGWSPQKWPETLTEDNKLPSQSYINRWSTHKVTLRDNNHDVYCTETCSQLPCLWAGFFSTCSPYWVNQFKNISYWIEGTSSIEPPLMVVRNKATFWLLQQQESSG